MDADFTFDESSKDETILEQYWKKVDVFVEDPNVDFWSFNNFGKRNTNTSVEVKAFRELQQYLHPQDFTY